MGQEAGRDEKVLSEINNSTTGKMCRGKKKLLVLKITSVGEKKKKASHFKSFSPHLLEINGDSSVATFS